MTSSRWENIRFGFLIVGLLACLAPFVMALQQSPQWQDMHQRNDDVQSIEISKLQSGLVDLRLDTAARLVRLETTTANLVKDVESLSARVWFLLIAVCAQLFNIAWAFIRERLRLKR